MCYFNMVTELIYEIELIAIISDLHSKFLDLFQCILFSILNIYSRYLGFHTKLYNILLNKILRTFFGDFVKLPWYIDFSGLLLQVERQIIVSLYICSLLFNLILCLYLFSFCVCVNSSDPCSREARC